MNTQVCVHILNRDLFTLYHWKFAILTLCGNEKANPLVG